ncbi:hypothetical protein XPA_010698 [Xanthoria parietina]
MQRRKNQKPTLLIATQKGHIHLVAAQTAEQQIPSPSRKKPSTASIRKPNVSLENHPNLEWDWSCGSPSWLPSAPYPIPGSWTARSETPKATRSQPWIPLPTLVAWYSLQGEESLDEHARAQATEKERSQKHDEENKKAKKEDRERRVKRDEEERMILREDAGRIQISIPHSMVQKCITATSTKEWGDLQEDAKALVAAEWRSRQRNG